MAYLLTDCCPGLQSGERVLQTTAQTPSPLQWSPVTGVVEHPQAPLSGFRLHALQARSLPSATGQPRPSRSHFGASTSLRHTVLRGVLEGLPVSGRVNDAETGQAKEFCALVSQCGPEGYDAVRRVHSSSHGAPVHFLRGPSCGPRLPEFVPVGHHCAQCVLLYLPWQSGIPGEGGAV